MTTTQTQVAIEFTAVIKQMIADHTEYPLVVEQQNFVTVDQVLQTNPYLRVKVVIMAANQADLADRPKVEQWGQLWISAVCKPGAGTAKVKALLDFVTPYFELKQIGAAVCLAAAAATGKEDKGMWVEPLVINFYYHRQT